MQLLLYFVSGFLFLQINNIFLFLQKKKSIKIKISLKKTKILSKLLIANYINYILAINMYTLTTAIND